MDFDEGVYTCGTDVCEVTWDRSLYQNASAVVFQDLYILNTSALPSMPRQPGQHWVFHKREGPRLRPVFRWYDGLFTMTMGYHHSYDILRPYGITLSKENEANPDYFDQNIIDLAYPRRHWVPTTCHKNFRNHTTKVLWYLSNCHYKTRNDYGRKLGNILSVDVYGHCGKPGPCVAKQVDPTIIRWRGEVQDVDNCEQEVFKKYKFYLSFENSQCEDYVTGKNRATHWRDFAVVSHQTHLMDICRNSQDTSVSYHELLIVVH